MNFLAHAYLSGDNDLLLLGNFIADAVKGSKYNEYEGDVRKGILLHRMIDTFMDGHPVVKESKARLRNVFGKYAPVVADVYYDHFLAAQWKNYHAKDLHAFCMSVYRKLESFTDQMPKETRIMLPYMVSNNWLEGYKDIEGIQRALFGLSRRTLPGSRMEYGGKELMLHYEFYQAEFLEFFPQMIAAAKEFIGKA